MSLSKEDAIRIVTMCAEKYHAELEGKSLLFLCLDKHRATVVYEFCFYKRNFLHLTGLKETGNEDRGEVLSAALFYDKCLSHKLSPLDFDFSEDGTTQLKLDVLPALIKKNLSANMIGYYDSKKPRLCTEKLAGNIKAGLRFRIGRRHGKPGPVIMLCTWSAGS